MGEEWLEETEVENGLQQGCTKAPTLFKLYACVVTEMWLERVCDVKDVGTHILFTLDQPLFRMSTKMPASNWSEKESLLMISCC